MTLSQLILHLQDLKRINGDLPVLVPSDVMDTAALEYLSPEKIDCHINVRTSSEEGKRWLPEAIIISTQF